MYLNNILENTPELNKAIQYYIYYNNKRVIGPYATERRAKCERSMLPSLLTSRALLVNGNNDYRICVYEEIWDNINKEYKRSNHILLTRDETDQLIRISTYDIERDKICNIDDININGYSRSSIYKYMDDKSFNKLMLLNYFTGSVEVKGE